MSARRRRGPGGWWPVVAPVVGAAIGAGASPWLAAHLSAPQALDPAVWTVLVPGRDEGLADSALTAGTGIVDGALLVSMRSFGRADLLIPAGEPVVAGVELTLAPGSGPVNVKFREPSGRVGHAVELGVQGWRTGTEAWRAYAGGTGPRVEVKQGSSWVNGERAEPTEPGALELSPSGPYALLSAIRLTDPANNLLLQAQFDLPEPSSTTRAALALTGAVVAALFTTIARAATSWIGAVSALLWLLPPLVALITPYPTWRALGQRLYLVHTPAGDLRLAACAAALLPLIAAGVLATGALSLVDRRALPTPLAVLSWVAVTLLAASDLEPSCYPLIVPGFFLLGAPVWIARRAGQSTTAVFLRDIPALVSIALGGWEAGLLPALLWRLSCVFADAPDLVRRGARAGADGLFLTLAVLPLAAELALRASYLGEAWSPSSLAGASTEGARNHEFSPFWEATCGADGAIQTVYTFGGSSAGGAYQYLGQPDAFFPYQVHQRLCATTAIRSVNYGNSGRDTWDAAQAAQGLFAAIPPAVVVLYAGVNDLLTTDAPLSRKQRAAALNARSGTIRTLDDLGSHSRLLTGLSLLTRAPEAAAGLVQAVPLDDAEENVRAIAAATIAGGGRLLLVSEYTEAFVDAELKPYQAMEARIAKELPGVYFLNLHDTLVPTAGEKLLLDRNHLTREGSIRVAELVTPLVERLLRGEDLEEG